MSTPNNFKYRYFNRGEWLYGNSIDSIANAVSRQNGISFSQAVTIVSSQMVPVAKQVVEQSFKAKPNQGAGLKLQEISAGAMSAMHQISGSTESQSVINRRAIACSACSNKSTVSGCMSCGFGSKLVSWANGVKKMFGLGHTIPNDLDKQYCLSCSCSLAMMLPAKLSDFKKSTITDPSRPDKCWLKTESKA